MGEVVLMRDYQSRAAIERAHKALEEHLNQQAIQIANEAFPSVFGFPAIPTDYDPTKQWPIIYRADDKDPA